MGLGRTRHDAILNCEAHLHCDNHCPVLLKAGLAAADSLGARERLPRLQEAAGLGRVQILQHPSHKGLTAALQHH